MTARLLPGGRDYAGLRRSWRRDVVAGVRPESFEDAALTGEARDQGITFKAKIDLVESMGSELYAYFDTKGGVESDQLAELAADVGIEDTPADEHTMVARLSPESGIRRGEEAELWLDTSRVHVFDQQSGKRLGS